MRTRLTLVFVVGALTELGACESRRAAVPPVYAPSEEPKHVDPEPLDPTVAAEPAEPKPADPTPEPTRADSEGTPRKRSADVSHGLAECKMPQPPGVCSSDADCSSFEIGGGPCGGCASTLSIGVTAAQKSSYLAKSKCQKAACNNASSHCIAY